MLFKLKQVLLITFTLMLILCAACGNITHIIGIGPSKREIEKSYKETESIYNGLLDGSIESTQQNWNDVIRQFSKLIASYPKSQFADNAQYHIGLCYVWMYGFWKDSPQKAIGAFDYLIRNYSGSKFLDGAHYWKAYSYSLKEDYKQAIEEYENFAAKYPKSSLYKDSLYQIEECRAKMNRHKKDTNTKILPKEEVKNMEVPEPAVIEKEPVFQQPLENSERSSVKDIRFHSWRDFTRVVIDLTKPAQHEVRKLDKPSRICINIKAAIIDPAKQTLAIDDELIQNIRSAQYDKNTVRIVFDIKRIKSYNIFYLKNPDRLVIDIYGNNSNSMPQDDKKNKPFDTKPSSIEYQKPSTLIKQLGLKVKTIVVDPGHGGKDPGALAKSGLQEKSFTLDIARRLKKLMESKQSYNIYLTRDSDIFIPLEDRAKFANQKEADIFISVHINSGKDQSARGIETYYLSLASDEDARLTAALENASADKGIWELGSLITKVLRSAKVNESRNLASIAQYHLCKHTEAANRGVKRAPFIVLIGAKAPSILVELGFISNENDEKLLNSEEYKDKLAVALMGAVEDYIKAINQAS